MAQGDITIHREGAFGMPGTRSHQVASGAAATIKAGELVLKTLGNQYVVVWTASNSAKPVVATDFVAGLSASTSTDTATADGIVSIYPIVPGTVYLGNVDSTVSNVTAGVFTSQANYDANIGKRVLLKTSSTGVQTILASDSATSGLVIEPLDIAKNPGKIAFSIRGGAYYLV